MSDAGVYIENQVTAMTTEGAFKEKARATLTHLCAAVNSLQGQITDIEAALAGALEPPKAIEPKTEDDQPRPASKDTLASEKGKGKK